MSDLVRYNSFDELKASSECTDTDVDQVRERHERFVEAMRFMRNEYIQSRTSSDDNTSVDISTVHELH